MANSPSFVLVATGLAFEARIARRMPPARVCCGRGPGLAASLESALSPGCRGIVSFGIAGGLDPALPSGCMVIAASVIGPHERFPADGAWSQNLARALPDARSAPLLGLDAAAMDPAVKARLFRDTGAAAVDMESHIAAGIASRHSLPFAALRAIADPAGGRVPVSAIAGLQPDGHTNVAGVMKSLLRNPCDLPALIHVARGAAKARSALQTAARQVGSGFGLSGLA
jgi:hopanoid-associated phosphorylase